MGGRTDIDNDDNEQQTSSTNVSRMTPTNSIKHESQTNPNQDFDENKMNDDDDSDLLIRDTILPHRKRIRKDTLQYIQTQQSTTSCKILYVSFIISFYTLSELKKSIILVRRQVLIVLFSSVSQ
jgi:hypothetical protein